MAEVLTQAPDLERRWSAIEGKLDAVSEELSRQGTLVCKVAKSGRKVWAVRYIARGAGGATHRSVYVGDDPELVRRAERLLVQYRQQRRQLEQIGAYARLAAGFVRVARRLARPG